MDRCPEDQCANYNFYDGDDTIIVDSRSPNLSRKKRPKPNWKPKPFSKLQAVACYRQLVMENFKKINASWITHNALCDPEKWGWKAGEEQVKNLQETHLEVYSANKCSEKFPNMYVLPIGEVDI